MTHLTVSGFIAMLEAVDRQTVVRFSVNGSYVDAPEIFSGSDGISLSFGAFARAQPGRERALANASDLIERFRAADETVEAAWSESNAESLLTWWEPRIAAARVARDDLLAALPVERSGPLRDVRDVPEPEPDTNFPRTRNSLDYFCGKIQEMATIVSRMQQNDRRRRMTITVSEFVAKLRRFERDAEIAFAMRGSRLGTPSVSAEAYGMSVSFRDRAAPRLHGEAAVANAREFIVTARKANGAFLVRAEVLAGVRGSERVQSTIEQLCEDEFTWWDDRVADARRVHADLLAFLPFEAPKRLIVLDTPFMARPDSFSEFCIELERLIILVERTI